MYRHQRGNRERLVRTYSHREILVMDDGSTNDTTDMVRCHVNVRYFYRTNSGLRWGP